jgi:hypothetical protein
MGDQKKQQTTEHVTKTHEKDAVSESGNLGPTSTDLGELCKKSAPIM